jgi:hypothetical protein
MGASFVRIPISLVLMAVVFAGHDLKSMNTITRYSNGSRNDMNASVSTAEREITAMGLEPLMYLHDEVVSTDPEIRWVKEKYYNALAARAAAYEGALQKIRDLRHAVSCAVWPGTRPDDLKYDCSCHVSIATEALKE